jgi:HEAT repeat protein
MRLPNNAKRPRRRYGAMLAAALMLACVFAIAWFCWPHLHAGFLSSRIEAAGGDELDEALHELVRIGPAGIDRLVALLGAQRAEVREAAFRIAIAKIDQRRRLGDFDGSAPLDRLAASLAGQLASFDREQLRLAAQLAERLLSASDRKIQAKRLRDCQVVIAADIRRRLGEQAVPQGVTNALRPSSERAHQIDELSLPLADPPASDLVAAISLPQKLDADLATEAKPLQPPSESAPPTEARKASAKDAATEKLQIDDNHSQAPLKREQSPDIRTTSTDSITGAQSNSRGDRSQPNRAAAVRPADLSCLLDLDARLSSDDPDIASEARGEMERERIDEAQLALARGAEDPDPVVRQELVEALSYVNAVDTRAWLLYLSHDDEATVRLAAVGRIATGEHAEFKKRLIELADSDGDERVRNQARVAVEAKKAAK